MTKGLMAVIGGGVLVVLFAIIMIVSLIGILNTEARLRTTIEAKQVDNTSEFDNLWKKISQTAEVTMAHKDALKEIFSSHAESRTGGKGQGGSVMSWIQESVPNVNLDTMKGMQNIIVSSRDAWTMRQKELIDLARERTQMFRTIPSNFFLAVGGRLESDVEITIVTSSRTDKAFQEGKDDNVELFKRDDKE